MSKKLSKAQTERLKKQKQELQAKYDKLYAIEKPSEDQLQELEDVSNAIAEVDEQLEPQQEAEQEIEDKNVIDFGDDDKKYNVHKNEEDYVHIKMYRGSRFDSDTGKEIAKYDIQKFNVNDFKNFRKQAARLGYKYGFLHKPKNLK